MTTTVLTPGTEVFVRSAGRVRLGRVVTTRKPEDAQTVWVCSEEEWIHALQEEREPVGVPWPMEAVVLEMAFD